MASFIEIPPLSRQISHNAKHVLMDRQRINRWTDGRLENMKPPLHVVGGGIKTKTDEHKNPKTSPRIGEGSSVGSVRWD